LLKATTTKKKKCIEMQLDISWSWLSERESQFYTPEKKKSWNISVCPSARGEEDRQETREGGHCQTGTNSSSDEKWRCCFVDSASVISPDKGGGLRLVKLLLT